MYIFIYLNWPKNSFSLSLYSFNCPFHVWDIMRHQKNAINIVPRGVHQGHLSQPDLDFKLQSPLMALCIILLSINLEH